MKTLKKQFEEETGAKQPSTNQAFLEWQQDYIEWLEYKLTWHDNEDELEFCNKNKWGDCECETNCRRGLLMIK